MGEKYTIFEWYSIFNQPNIIFYYRGPISSIVLRDISKFIRDQFKDNPLIFRRIFAVYMELAQNILYYSAEKIISQHCQDSVGIIYLIQDNNDYYLCCGNLIENEFLNTLYDSCDFINTLDRKNLRDYKREQRKAPPKERSKGAGIGLIQVALTSRNPIYFTHRKIDDGHSIFSLTIKINESEMVPTITYPENNRQNI